MSHVLVEVASSIKSAMVGREWGIRLGQSDFCGFQTPADKLETVLQ